MSDSWMQYAQAFWQSLISAASLKAVLATLVALMGSLFGMTHPAVKCVVVLMVIDFVLGASCAWRKDDFRWSGVKKGIAKFVGYSMALCITSVADWGLQTGGFITMTGAFCFYLIVCDAMSALYHVNDFAPGVVPVWLFKRLKTFKHGLEEGDPLLPYPGLPGSGASTAPQEPHVAGEEPVEGADHE
ncbi:phage holin family protein [Desulfovibrio sp. OttesenSCG-928-C06]|nr:phage holin family protein [Desulfovibrio sp. OttesenSCG-928-C06]